MYELTLLTPVNSFARFLAEYWQKKPCVIRQAFVDFQDPIDENDLAGMAMESDIDSRIISQNQSKWAVTHGPFASFESACQGQWTLLVQSVDQYSPDVRELLQAFSAVPQWRVEDIMVSFSVAGAGVGRHLDQYDVFIVQGKGSRRWQVGPKGVYTEHCPHPNLRQIDEFPLLIDEILLPGDLIYIPPGFPHNGVALEPCLNYSIGFRAPNTVELLSGFADWASQELSESAQRYQDPDLSVRRHPFEIKSSEMTKFRQLLTQMIDSEQFEDFILHYLTSPPQTQDYLADVEENYSAEKVASWLQNGTAFFRAPFTRVACLEPLGIDETPYKSTCKLSINQHMVEVPKALYDEVLTLLDAPYFCLDQKIYYENSLFFVQFVSTLLSTGSYGLEDPYD